MLGAAVAAVVPSGAAAQQRPGNWGRWGEGDQRDSTGPVFPGRVPPLRLMSVSGADYAAGEPLAFGAPFHIADDYLFMPIQGSTQWDALSHAWQGEALYNGVPQTEVRGSGANRLGIQNVKDGLVGRGVLIDVLGHKEARSDAAIARADLEDAGATRRHRAR
jgi:hypothetical protein